MAAMGSFTEPVLPDVDLDDWASRPYFERLRAMCVDWTVHGFGIPPVAYLFYAVKLLVYVGGFVFVASLTPGIGGVTDVGDWWFEPIVFPPRDPDASQGDNYLQVMHSNLMNLREGLPCR